MDTARASRSDPGSPGPRAGPDGDRHEARLAEIGQVIEQIGARYTADLRSLSQAFAEVYEDQLAAKDEQLAELTRRAEAAERELEARAARIRALERVNAAVADLQALSEEVHRRLTAVGRELGHESRAEGGHGDNASEERGHGETA